MSEDVMPGDAFMAWPCQSCQAPVRADKAGVFLSFRFPEGVQPPVADYVFCSPRCLVAFIIDIAVASEKEEGRPPKPPRGWRRWHRPPRRA